MQQSAANLDQELINTVIDALDPVSVCILHHYAESGKAKGFSLSAEELDAIKNALERLRGTADLRRAAVGLLYLAQAFEANASPEAAKALYTLMSWGPLLETIEELRLEGLDEKLERAASKVTGHSVPLVAKNPENLARMSQAFQDMAIELTRNVSEPHAVHKSDVVKLQKLFPRARELSRLKRPDFDRVIARREAEDVVFALEDGASLARVTVQEFTSVLGLEPQTSVVH